MTVGTSATYPKMITAQVVDAIGNLRTVPALYPAGHAKQFTYAIVQNAADEAAAIATGLVAASVEYHHHS